jgi:hypothetical protein
VAIAPLPVLAHLQVPSPDGIHRGFGTDVTIPVISTTADNCASDLMEVYAMKSLKIANQDR